MNLDRVIAVRNTKTVYRDGDKCIKVFNEDFSKADVLNEALNQARIEETGLKIPKILEVTMIDGKWAIVSQFIKGKTLSQLIKEEPEKTNEHIEMLVELQLEIQSKTCPLLNKLKDKMNFKIMATSLDATTRYDLHTRIEGMPKHSKVCHGDFCPSNVSNKVLLPASTANGTAWFSAEAQTKTAFDKKTGTDFAGITDVSNYCFAEELNVMNKGEATVENVTISFSGLTNKYARVAVVEANATSNIIGTFTESVYDVDGAAYDAVVDATNIISITPKTTYTINIGNLAYNEAKYYNIYVWFEGQDVDCFDGNAGQAIEDITFTVTGETEDQV